MENWSRFINLTCLCLVNILYMISRCQSRSIMHYLEACPGDDVVLQCGSSNIYPRWYGPDRTEVCLIRHNGTEYTDKKHRLFYCENKRDLCFASLRISDSGVYTCQTEQYSILSELKVQKREILTDLSERSGTDITIRCDLNITLPDWVGPEFPTVPLVYGNTSVFNHNTRLVKENRLSFCENQRDLCIKDLKTYDEGDYQCIWLDVGTHTTTLSVRKQDTRSNQTQKIGDNVILRCDFNGTNPTWYGPENQNLNPIKEGRWSYDKNMRDLYIENLEKTDFGKYKCVMPGLGNHTINLRQESENETSAWGPITAIIVPCFVIVCIILTIFWKSCQTQNVGKTEALEKNDDTRITLIAENETNFIRLMSRGVGSTTKMTYTMVESREVKETAI